MARSLHPPPRRRLVRRSHRSIVGLLVTVAVVGWVLTLPWRGPAPPGSWSGRFPADGLGLVVLLGLTAGRDDGVERLVEEIQRFRDGEDDVDFATDRDDEVGELYAAVGDMAEALEACERELEETRERVRERAHDLERYRPLVESAGEPMAVLDAEGRFEVLNEAMANFHGTSREELLGTDARQLVVADGVAAIEDAQRRLLSEPDRQWEQVEVDLTDADGEEHRYEANVGVIRDEEGTFDGSVLAFRDVTERVEKERQLSRLMSNVPGLVYHARNEPEWPTEFVSEGVREIAGYDPETFMSGEVSWGEDVMVEQDGEVWETVQDALEAREPYRVSYPIETADGQRRWVDEQGRGIYADDGSVQALEGVVIDISERIEYQQELERTRGLLELSQLLAQVGAWEVPVRDGRPQGLTATEEVYRIFGLSPEADLTFEESLEYYQPGGRQRVEDAMMDAITDGQGYDVEVRLQTAADELLWVRAIGEPVSEDGEVVALRGSIQDITERKEREEELRERERDLQEHKAYTTDILDAIDDVFYVIDQDGNFLRWNESARAVTGYDDEEIASTNALAFFPEEYHPRILAAMDEVFGSTESRRVEAPLVTSGDGVIPHEFVATTVENPAGEEVLVGIGRDITERKRREAALERTTELLEQAQRIAAVGGWEFDAATETLTVTDEFRRLHGIEPDEPVTIDDVLERYHEDDFADIEETFEAAIEQGKGYDMEVRLRITDGTTRWVRSLAEPIEEDGETSMLRGSVQDITEAKEREEAIRTLHDTAQELLQTETASEVADLVVETAADVLDVSGVSLYLLDADANLLVPEACSASFEELTDGAPPIAIGDEEDPIWNSFATGTRQVVDASDVGGGTGPFTKGVGGGLVVPIGAHGVFVVTTAQSGVEVRTRQLVETLIATTEAAFDRLESEANLQERDAELEAQNRRLRRQIQLTDVLRRVDRSLIGANGHEEIERAVCEQLADSEDIAFAWIGSVDPAGETVVPRTWAGDGDAYLDAVSLSMAESAAEPAVGTAHRGEPTVVSNVLAEVSDEAWRKSALDSGFRSALAVPIAFEEYRHGVLAVYADEADAFEELERTVFAELGRTIANAINAVQTREALHADTLLELSLRIEAPDTFLAQVARRADRDVEYVGIGRQSGEETSVFFAVEGAADVEAVLDELVTVTEHRLLSEREDRRVFEATVTGEVLPAKLIRHGAQPKTIRASPADVSVVLSVPTSTDVREFVEMLQESYPTVELEGRRNVTRATRTRQQMVSDLLEGLTERQLEVLRTAYYADYFDWPRGSSGEEIAEMLDVTQPTVSRHLRLGQRQLLSRLLEEEPTTVTAS